MKTDKSMDAPCSIDKWTLSAGGPGFLNLSGLKPFYCLNSFFFIY
jgi:hypothetical protein